jgi:hypothetical protein
MQDKHRICGGQYETDRYRDKHYYPESIFHFTLSSFMSRTDTNHQP